MAEFNPYKLEEEKWTPNNVYEILPPNAVSWSDYDFGQGTDNVDRDAAEKSFIDGFVDFFKDLFGVAGQILGGALEFGGAILGGFVSGVINFVGGIANAIGSIFGGGNSESPSPPLFNPIKTNLEAAIQPHRDKINESWQKTEEILAEQEVLRGQMAVNLDAMREARDRADEAIEKSGQSIAEAQAASDAAEAAREQLEAYNTELNQRITTEFNSAVGRANTAVEKADTLAGELADFQARHQIEIDDAIGKAEQAVADLATLSPRVEEAVSNSAAATSKVLELSPQVKQAGEDASTAVAKADQTLADYTAWAAAQKTRIDSAVSKAEAATANVATLTPQVADAVAKSTAATNDVSTLTPKVTKATADAKAANDKVAELTPQVASAVSEAAAATANVATLTPKVNDAATKATKASTDVSTLTPKVTKATTDAANAVSSVETLTPQVSDAASKAAKASTDVSALSPRVDDAVAKANKATSDLSTLTPKVTAAQTRADSAYTAAESVRSEVTPKIEAAQTKGESALAVADKAVDWLRNPKEIGASLITYDPETKKPNWAEHLHEVPEEENPLGLPDAYRTGEYSYRNPRRMPVNVDPSTEYIVSLWVKADKPGSDMTFDLRNQSGDHVFLKSREVPGFPNSGDNWRPYWIKDVPTEWTQYKKVVTPRETTRTAAFVASYFNHSNGDTRDAVQYIADFQIYPLVPSQLDVDQAQNDAIRANSEILRQQGEINEAQRVANLANQAFIDNQTKWNTASSNATKALQDFATLQGVVNAEQTKFNTFQTDFNTKQTKWNKASEDATKALSDAQQVQSNLNIEQGKLNTLQSNFNTKQTEWNAGTTAALEAQKKVNDNFTKWNTAATQAKAAQDKLNEKQDEWNAGVTAALETQKKVNDNFNEWTAGAATAIAANTTAIKALSKIDIGESLIAYLTPTDAEVKAGTAKYDVPVWTTGAHREFNGNNAPPAHVKYAFGASSNEGTKAARSSLVAVRPGTKYILSFWAYGSGDLVVYMLGNGSGHPVRSTRQLMVDQDTLEVLKDAGGRRRYDPANNGNSSNTNGTQWLLSGFKPDELYKWVHYKFEVEFTESTTEVRFQNFYWNWTESSVYGQYLAGMQFYPDVPTQASVDAAQNKSIEALELFQQKQQEWSAGVDAALTTQETVDQNLQKWSEGATTAIEANTRALAIINAGKQGSNIIPVNPISGRPWFAEPLKESTDHPPLTSGPTYYSPAAQASVLTHGPKVEVDPKIRYTLSFWAKASKAGSVLYGQFRSQDGGNVTPTGEPLSKGAVTVANPPQPSNKDSNGNYVHAAPSNSYFVSNLKLNTTWTYYETEIQFNEGVTSVSISRMYWSHSSGVAADQYISGLSIRPQIPTQASVDKAQNDAISANTEALKALGKKVLGASLVPYRTPSTKEVEDYTAGKLDYDPWAEPEYYDAGWTVDLSPGEGKRTPRAAAGNTTKVFRGTFVSVDSSITYRVKFRTYAGAARSGMSIAFLDQNGLGATEKTPFTTVGSGNGYLLYRYPLGNGWANHEGVITFKPGVKEVQLGSFYWNSTTGTGMDTTTTQRFLDLEIVPNIPSQAVVDELQDNAIRKNTAVGSDNKIAIEALRDGLNASIELETVNELIGGLEERIHQEEKARAKLQAKIDDLQNEMIPRTIVWESGRETLDDYISIPASNRIVALPGWTGQMVVTSVLRRGRGTEREPTYYQTSIDRYSVPDGTSRSWTLPSGTSYEGITSLRVDYWIYRGKTRAINMANGGGYITGSSYVRGSERTIASYKVGKTYGTGQIEWRAQLKNANRGTTYRFTVRVTGQPDKTFTWSSVGPLTGLGSGLVTLKFDHEFNLPDNATVSIVTYTNASTSSRAIVNYSMGILTYVENTQ